MESDGRTHIRTYIYGQTKLVVKSLLRLKIREIKKKMKFLFWNRPHGPLFPLLCSVKNHMRNISLSWFFWVRWYFNSENPRICLLFVRLKHDDINFVPVLDLLQLIRNPNCDCCIKLNYLLYSISSKILVNL